MTSEQVQSYIQALDPSNATWLDGLGPKIFKLAINSLNPTIAILINKAKVCCKQNKMHINFDKTTYMVLGTRYKLRDAQFLNLIIDNQDVKHVSQQKLLLQPISRVHTDLTKQNSLIFPWLFPDVNPNFPDITVLAGETWFYSNLCLIVWFCSLRPINNLSAM